MIYDASSSTGSRIVTNCAISQSHMSRNLVDTSAIAESRIIGNYAIGYIRCTCAIYTTSTPGRFDCIIGNEGIADNECTPAENTAALDSPVIGDCAIADGQGTRIISDASAINTIFSIFNRQSA